MRQNRFVSLSLSICVCVSACVCGCAGPQEEVRTLCPPFQLFLENRNLQMINVTADLYHSVT